MKNKKVIYIVAAVVVVVLLLILCVSCAIKGKDEKVQETISKWPDLTKYEIPNIDFGTDIKVKNESNKDGYILDYVVELEGVSEKDLENYIKKYSDKWTKTEADSTSILARDDSANQYTVVINHDKKAKTAKIVITSIIDLQ